MTKFASRTARLSGWLSSGIELVLMALIVVTLTDWWGMSWVIAVLLPLAIFLVLIPIVFRLVRGEWPSFFATVFGSLGGWAVVMSFLPVLLVFPIVYRLVEGEWPITFLYLWAGSVILHLTERSLERIKQES